MLILLYRMSYARAVKKKPVQSLNSAAETELQRKLTEPEAKLLDERFSLSTVENCVEKVYISKIYLIGHILH